MDSCTYALTETDSVPPHPGVGWTRFVCISDSHSAVFNVPPGDVLLHAGDLSSWGYPKQVKKTLSWLKTLEHPIKLIIAGNHDLCLDPQWDGPVGTEEQQTERQKIRSFIKGSSMKNSNIHYLEHGEFMFKTLSGKSWLVYGSPAAEKYADGAFQYSTAAEADEIYARIPSSTDILMTHTPPHMLLDLTRQGKHAGCPHLAKRLELLKSCRLHVFGHIHEGHGVFVAGGRVSVNAAISGGHYPVIVDLKNQV